MKVFISWSGDRSRALAEILHQWLPAVVQAVRPYYSPDDIAKGTRWSGEIAKELESSRVGLICLTADNLAAPWIMFEAGALSKNLDRSRVCPILFGVEPSDIEGPLVQFQACKFGRTEMERVVRMINGELGEGALSGDVLDSVFDMWWPRLQEQVEAVLAKAVPDQPSTRSERELIEEVLGLTRSLARSTRDGISPAAILELDEYYSILRQLVHADNVDKTLKRTVLEMAIPVRYLVRRANIGDGAFDTDARRLKIRQRLFRGEEQVSLLPDAEDHTQTADQ